MVRQLDDEIVRALRARAAKRGRSAEAEHREILRQALVARVTSRADRQVEAREWLAYARANIAHAEAGRASEALIEYLCFDARQAAEKALKAALISRGIRPPAIEDPGELTALLALAGVKVPDEIHRAQRLGSFTWHSCYPGSTNPSPDEDALVEALSIAQAVIDWAAEMIEDGPPE